MCTRQDTIISTICLIVILCGRTGVLLRTSSWNAMVKLRQLWGRRWAASRATWGQCRGDAVATLEQIDARGPLCATTPMQALNTGIGYRHRMQAMNTAMRTSTKYGHWIHDTRYSGDLGGTQGGLRGDPVGGDPEGAPKGDLGGRNERSVP